MLGVVFTTIQNIVSCSPLINKLWYTLYFLVIVIVTIGTIIVEAVVNISMITDILSYQSIKIRYKKTRWGRFNEFIGFKRKIIGLFALLNIMAFAVIALMAVASILFANNAEMFSLATTFSVAFYPPLHCVRFTNAVFIFFYSLRLLLCLICFW